MSNYDRKVSRFTQHAALVDAAAADLRIEGEKLANLHQALRLAFEERMGREYRSGDEFTEGDNERAEQLLLELFPASGA